MRIQVFKNNKPFSFPGMPAFKSAKEAKDWISDYDRGGPCRWRREAAEYSDGPRIAFHGGPGNAWEVRVTSDKR